MSSHPGSSALSEGGGGASVRFGRASNRLVAGQRAGLDERCQRVAGDASSTEDEFVDQAKIELRDRLISLGLSREDAGNVIYPSDVISRMANNLAEQHAVLMDLIEQTIDAYDEGTLDELAERWRSKVQSGD